MQGLYTGGDRRESLSVNSPILANKRPICQYNLPNIVPLESTPSAFPIRESV